MLIKRVGYVNVLGCELKEILLHRNISPSVDWPSSDAVTYCTALPLKVSSANPNDNDGRSTKGGVGTSSRYDGTSNGSTENSSLGLQNHEPGSNLYNTSYHELIFDTNLVRSGDGLPNTPPRMVERDATGFPIRSAVRSYLSHNSIS